MIDVSEYFAKLFTTTTCPKCPEFKKFSQENCRFSLEVLNEKSENFSQEISEFGVSAAPTILIFKKNKEVFRTSDLSELDNFLKNSF